MPIGKTVLVDSFLAVDDFYFFNEQEIEANWKYIIRVSLKNM